MNASAVRGVLTSEWTKIWTVLLTFLLSIGLSYLVGLRFRNAFYGLPREQQETFDPLFATFYSLTLRQLALVVFGCSVSSEYTSGTIHASLVAVPRRGLFYGSKVLAGALPVFGVSLITVLVTFFTAQAALGPHGTSLGADRVLPAIVGACLYLTLIDHAYCRPAGGPALRPPLRPVDGAGHPCSGPPPPSSAVTWCCDAATLDQPRGLEVADVVVTAVVSPHAPKPTLGERPVDVSTGRRHRA